MTAYKARLGRKIPTTFNKKDGGTAGRSSRSRGAGFEEAGFTLVEPPAKWSYSWAGVFPVFQIEPGIANDRAGLVAEWNGVTEWFQYGTPAADIKARLDDLILQIMRHEAELNDLPLIEIFEEIPFDDFSIRPRSAAIQRTPAAAEMASRHGIPRAVAGEMLTERGE